MKKASSGVLAGHCRLSISAAFTNVTLFLHRDVRLIILRVADLAAALLVERRVLARRGWAGEMLTFLNSLRASLADLPRRLRLRFKRERHRLASGLR